MPMYVLSKLISGFHAVAKEANVGFHKVHLATQESEAFPVGMSRAETKTWAFAQLVPSIETMRRPFWVSGKSGFQKGYIRGKGLAPVQGIACSIHALYCDICWLQLTYIFLKLKPAKKLFWVTVPILRGYSM